MRRLVALTLFLLFPCVAFAIPGVPAPGPTYAVTPPPPGSARRRQTACTRTIAANLTAIDQAIYGDQLNGVNHDGDVICIQAGAVNVTSLVMLGNHNIELRGAGSFESQGSAGQTIFYYRDTGGNQLLEVNEATGGNSTISNIQFVWDHSSPAPPQGEVTMLTIKTQANGQPTLWHHNDFLIDSLSCSYPKILGATTKHGVVYRNRFVNTPISGSPCFYSTTSQEAMYVTVNDTAGAYWDSASTMGSADTDGTNQFYVETNYFESFAVTVDRQTSSRTVWRFNTMNGATITDHGFDSSTFGERYGEIYNNDFRCDSPLVVALNGWVDQRGGTAMVFNNTFAELTSSGCGYPNGGYASSFVSQFKLKQCDGIPGWPGTYPITYPVSHQVGWGWRNPNTNTGVGSDSAQGQPGTSIPGYPYDGFNQSLEPLYYFNNTNNNPNGLLYVEANYPGECRAMAFSSSGKTSGTTLVSPGLYFSAGQTALIVMADLVGGSTPTISDNQGTTYTALQGGSNGSIRLTAWTGTIGSSGVITATASFGSSSSARVMSLVAIRNLSASPVDKNPAVSNITANATFTSPATGTLTQAEELVIGYYAVNAPTTMNAAGVLSADALTATTGYKRATYYGLSAGDVGIYGTTGGSDTSNVTVGVIYKAVNSTTSEVPVLEDGTSARSGVAGTVSFKVNGNAATLPSVLDLQVVDFIQADREYYLQTAMFDGTSGTGSGPRASRPATCTTGVAWWSTDQGDWNSSGAGGQGVLDKCTDGMNANPALRWTNAWYVPYDYPHPLATVNSVLTFDSQPTNVHTGGTIASFTVSGSSLTGDVTIALTSACGTTLGGTLTATPSMNAAVFDAVTATGAGASCTLTASSDGFSDAISSVFSVGPNKLGITSQPAGSVVSGNTVAFTVAGQFASNSATDTSANNSVTITATATSGSCSVSGSTTQSLSSGVRAFTVTITGAGVCRLTAAATGLTSANTNTFSVTSPVTPIAPGGGSNNGLTRRRKR